MHLVEAALRDPARRAERLADLLKALPEAAILLRL
jgi:hypothetical protein